ncbi:efflux transporter outer membrane subunit [Derxia gummosa]|uniref:Efflux transporter outer membrane subunit n=1 Tax=Derxia gummosa DSM 723 TaxID=1121388 RepID=A0A8B6XBK9_9BURK|nr:efflux transporter outer membrane subunit [Derxia gummosa]
MNTPARTEPASGAPDLGPRAAAPARPLRRAGLAVLAALAIAGCADMRGIAPTAQLSDPAAIGAGRALPEGASASATTAARPADNAAPPITWPGDRWWTSLGDDRLTALIDNALADAPSMRIAAARLAQAQAGTETARAALLPRADAQASVTRERFTENYIYPAPLAGSVDSDALLRLGGQWELDLFGRNRAALEAALGQARAAEADLAAARWILSTQIATAYIDLARDIELRELLIATREQRQHIRQLVSDRVSAGLDTNVELRQAETTVPQTGQDIAAAEERIELGRITLAALAGIAPQTLADLKPALGATRVLPPPAVIPADLIGRRADVTGARRRVEAALAGVDVARAAFYPNVNLSAFVGFHALGLGDWIDAGSREWGVAPAISLPIFEGGRLRAQLKTRAAAADEAIGVYNLTLTLAIRDVANALTSGRAIDRQAEQQRAAQAAAESAYDLAEQRYRAGLGSFLTVLSAESSVLAERRRGTELRARALENQISLVRALGGGYTTGS